MLQYVALFMQDYIACGTLQKRAEILAMLKALPEARLLAQKEVLSFLEARRLYGRGIGWVDAHLLASTMLTGCSLWTIDKPLRRAAAGLDVLV